MRNTTTKDMIEAMATVKTGTCEQVTAIWFEDGGFTITGNAERCEQVKRALEFYEKHKWQPIETAPKDGRKVLLSFCDSDVLIGFWCNSPPLSSWRSDNRIVYPESWSPLQTAPKVGE